MRVGNVVERFKSLDTETKFISGAGAFGLVAAMAVGGTLYGSDHCAPWERWGKSDYALAADALQCAEIFEDFRGAEANVEAIDSPAFKGRARQALDYAEVESSLLYAFNDNKKSTKALDYIDKPSLRKAAKEAIQTPNKPMARASDLYFDCLDAVQAEERNFERAEAGHRLPPAPFFQVYLNELHRREWPKQAQPFEMLPNVPIDPTLPYPWRV